MSSRRGLTEITAPVRAAVRAAGVAEGLCTVFVRYTSASLVIQENADPAARRDLEAFLGRLVPDGDSLYTHTAEGDDDMPSHVKAALPGPRSRYRCGGASGLGTWQGIYLWEHRSGPHRREVVVHVLGE